MSSSSSRCVLLFARSPREEERAKELSRSRGLFAAIRQQMIRESVKAGAELLECTTHADDSAASILQRGSSFGERLSNAFADAFAAGYRKIIAIPLDVPELSAGDLIQAFDALEQHDFVFGPSPDGGIYLFGARIAPDAVLQNISWHSSAVFDQLCSHCETAAILRPLRDLDRFSDLRLLESLAPVELSRLIHALLSGQPQYPREFLPTRASRSVGSSSGTDPPSPPS